jgi:hypothetical protein
MTTDEALVALAQGDVKGTILIVNAADILMQVTSFVALVLIAWGARTLWAEYQRNTRIDPR